jgi:hypothetical protein
MAGSCYCPVLLAGAESLAALAEDQFTAPEHLV